jgi:hypothetical protein
MENIQSAINNASQGKPHEFKSYIEDILADKVSNFLAVKKMEMAGSIFNDEGQQQEDQQQEFQFSSEGNVDEDL